MPDLLAPEFPDELDERLAREDYKQDFRERRAAIRDGESWTLERLQHLEETNDDSREALRQGDWPAVLRLFEAERDALVRRARDEASRARSSIRPEAVLDSPAHACDLYQCGQGGAGAGRDGEVREVGRVADRNSSRRYVSLPATSGKGRV
jgi:hypothetical protein